MALDHPATGLRQGSFGVATLAKADHAFPALVLPDGATIDLSARFADTHAIFDDWERNFDTLRGIAAKSTHADLRFEDLRALPPLAHPNMLCTGANYRQHVIEMLTHGSFNQHNRQAGESDEALWARNSAIVDKRAREGTPFFWTGLHSSLGGADDDVMLPPSGKNHDWELELAAVIGKGARHVAPEGAMALVAGYVMVNDLGTLDQFRRTDIPWGFDWVSKNQPGFKPAGPFVVPAAFVDLNEVRIKLKVNGETKQDWPVTDMIFSIDKIVSYASERVRLMPGDFLLTGSPPGNGSLRGQFLKHGDVIESEISCLGRQRNRCVDEPGKTRWPFPQN